MAQNLHHVRQMVGADLVRQVDKITRDMGQETERIAGATLPGDGRRLRGIPMYAKGVSGIQTDCFVPGSDEHLDELDAA